MTQRRSTQSDTEAFAAWNAAPAVQEAMDSALKRTGAGLKETERLANEWTAFWRAEMEEALAAGTAWARCSSIGELVQEGQEHQRAMAEHYIAYTRKLPELMMMASSAFLNAGSREGGEDQSRKSA